MNDRDWETLKQQDINNIIDIVKSQDAEIANLKSEIKHLEENIKLLKEKYRVLEVSSYKLTDDFDDEVEKKVEERLAEIAENNLADSGFVSDDGHNDTQEKLANAEGQIDALNAELEEALRELDATRAERDARPNTDRLAEMYAQVLAKAEEADTFFIDVQNYLGVNLDDLPDMGGQTLEEALANSADKVVVEARLVDVQAQLTAAQNQIATLTGGFDIETLTDLENELNNFEKLLADEKAAHAATQAESTLLRDQVNALIAELTTAQTKAEKLDIITDSLDLLGIDGDINNDNLVAYYEDCEKVKKAEKFGLTDWNNLAAQTEGKTLGQLKVGYDNSAVAKKYVQSLTKEVEILENENKSLENENQVLNELLVEKNNELDENDIKFEQFENEITIKDNEIQQLKDEIIAKDTELNEKDEQITDLGNEVNNLSNILVRERSDFSVELAQKDTQINQWFHDYNQLKANKNQEISDLQTKLEEKETECQSLSQANTDLQTEIATINSQNGSLEQTSCQENCCLGDYARIKNELVAKEGEIVEKMNCSCSETINSNLRLGLEFGSGDERDAKINKVFQEIIKLLTKPDNNNENFKEGLKIVKEIDINILKGTLDKIPVVEKATEIIENACNYEEITVARQGAIEHHYNNQLKNLNKQKEEISKQLVIERIILASSLLVGLLMTVLLIFSFKTQKKLRSANKKSKLLDNWTFLTGKGKKKLYGKKKDN